MKYPISTLYMHMIHIAEFRRRTALCELKHTDKRGKAGEAGI